MRHGFRVSVGADTDGLDRVNAAFAAFAEEHELPDDVRRRFSVALDEMVANVLAHALEGRKAASLAIDADLEGGRLAFTLTDDGPPFDPFSHAAPDTALSVEDRPIGGLGIHLVRGLMDEVSYERRDGQNVVTLVKNLAETG